MPSLSRIFGGILVFFYALWAFVFSGRLASNGPDLEATVLEYAPATTPKPVLRQQVPSVSARGPMDVKIVSGKVVVGVGKTVDDYPLSQADSRKCEYISTEEDGVDAAVPVIASISRTEEMHSPSPTIQSSSICLSPDMSVASSATSSVSTSPPVTPQLLPEEDRLLPVIIVSDDSPASFLFPSQTSLVTSTADLFPSIPPTGTADDEDRKSSYLTLHHHFPTVPKWTRHIHTSSAPSAATHIGQDNEETGPDPFAANGESFFAEELPTVKTKTDEISPHLYDFEIYSNPPAEQQHAPNLTSTTRPYRPRIPTVVSISPTLMTDIAPPHDALRVGRQPKLRTLMLPQEVARRSWQEFTSAPMRGLKPLRLPMEVAQHASLYVQDTSSPAGPDTARYTESTSGSISSGTKHSERLSAVVSLLDASGLLGSTNVPAFLAETCQHTQVKTACPTVQQSAICLSSRSHEIQDTHANDQGTPACHLKEASLRLQSLVSLLEGSTAQRTEHQICEVEVYMDEETCGYAI